jgi:uncharacterized protein YjbI with pentapeptide repeats
VKGEYENCEFVDCDLSNLDLSGFGFSECRFSGCNVSLAKISQTAFKDIRFVECKLMGLHFENCNTFLFAIECDRCTLNLSSFYKLNLKRSQFKNCTLQEVDFTESDLSSSILDCCDLTGAIFEHTILEKTDFRSAYNYSIDPEKNRIRKARFSLSGVGGLLEKYGIEIE